jgi:hypothetical protein
MDMESKQKLYHEKVIWVHSVIMTATVVAPVTLLLLKAITIRQCFALFGTGFFILAGHTLAFFESYLEYFRKVDMMKVFEETTVRKLLRVGIGIDLVIAVFFYLLGVQ